MEGVGGHAREPRPWSGQRRRHGAVAVAAFLALGCLLALLRSGDGSAAGGQGLLTSPTTADTAPGWGLTHTQYSADNGDPTADAAAQALLAQSQSAQSQSARTPLAQDQAMMGWGADNPEPSPGVYDFTRLDSRIRMITRSGGRPVITLCCAPDWMKGGPVGRTDWSRLETAPSADHYADFAALAATVARRYPQVHDFVVWNEFKGFFDNGSGQWDAAAYTALYNEVYRAIKAVSPGIAVGGPYLPMDSFPLGSETYASAVSGRWGTLDQRVVTAFDYWLQHKAGADFVVVDGSTVPKDGAPAPDPFAATEKFTAVSRWLRDRTTLPLWWAEWYVEPPNSGWNEPYRDAVLASGMIALAEARVSAAFYWNPETNSADCPGCLWSASGAPLPPLALLRGFARWFPPSVAPVPVAVADPRVRVLAQAAEGVAVNTTGGPLRTTVDGRSMSLGPYQILWFAR
ncbi:xylan 1,4-beta-xylosidase [Streptacidiphilus sp. MAP12-20]|uniref:GH39 family glycosyl hydrolase n=1 Tax=Streptacidiphilus sp. MAP12-20 TaxID=3156299 RepID=UPI0035159971